MKTYTDLEQSKKLAEILPIESADMAWYPSYAKEGYSIRMLNDTYPLDIIGEEHDDIPAWSLSALLSVIPVYIEYQRETLKLRIDKGPDDFNIWYDTLYSGVKDGFDFIAKEPIDACYKMILMLNEQKLL